MVVRCNRCMGFKKSRKSACKKCKSRRGKRGREFGSFLEKAARLTKRALNSDIDKFTINQVLAYAPKLLDLDASKIKNKKVKLILKSEMTKKLLNRDAKVKSILKSEMKKKTFKKRCKRNIFNIVKNMSVKGFGVTTSELERFLTSNGKTMKSQFVGVFPADKKEKTL